MKITAISRLTRLPNLLMVILTMYLMRFAIIKPILQIHDLDLQVGEFSFLLLVFSTILLTAAGYVINDYHDVRADRINHPDKVVIDNLVTRRSAMKIHVMLNTIGAITGIMVACIYRTPWLAAVFLLVPILLWGYSVYLKHLAVLGNVAVAVLSGMVPLLVVLFEYPLLVRHYPEFVTFFPGGFRNILFWVGMFSLFAFLTTLIRELIKDAEDVEGDREVGSHTLPVLKGMAVTRLTVIVLSLVTLAILFFFFFRYLNDWISLGYLLLFLFVPFLILIIKTLLAKEKREFHFLSQWIKWIMLLGLAYAPIACCLIKTHY
ncbi:MAG: geranylgeranylglycerol-phosphate geranylgeranyltransferase [Bacteroidales bacterium]|nr:geranylgeranylglycerol-phosphate geranylgeranyltransferase [Bacteroidales bacterium]